MDKRELLRKAVLAGVVTMRPAWAITARAQTTPNVTVQILGTGTQSLLGGDLTDPDNNGEDLEGSATSPTWNWTEITSSHKPDFEGGENAFNIFDNKVGGGNNKWCCDDPIVDTPVWVAVKFAQPASLTHFTVTSGNDAAERDPTDWAIQGSNDGTTFADIYRFRGSVVPWTARDQVVRFDLPGPSLAYTTFRYIAYATPGPLHQLNEVELFGLVGGAPDTDGDGMPNAYETKLGFNPNDATDGAKDFDGDGVSNVDEYKAGSDPIDTTKPTVVSVASSGSFNAVTLTFSEDLDPATAATAANYTITPALAVTGATYNSKVVTLTTAAQTPGATAYTVTVNGVRDLSKNVIATDSKATFYSYLLVKEGALKFSYWGDVAGTPVQGLLDDPRYPASPDMVAATFQFSSRDVFPDDSHENYGAQMEGLLTPTESGSYRFFVYSDDASQLYLSTDATAANLQMIAEEPGCCNNFTEPDGSHTRTSEPITLTAGTKYYIRLIYKEGGGGDYGLVAWRKEGDPTPAASLTVIPGRFLSNTEGVPAPAEGAYTVRTPGVNAGSVSPDTGITIVHRDGQTPWTPANVSLTVDGAPVAATITKDGSLLRITYKPASLWPSGSTHTIAVSYQDPGGNAAVDQWSFTVSSYKGPLLDKVAGRHALVLGLADQTPDKGGRTGADGDRALDTGVSAGSAYVYDATFLNTATGDDTLTVAYFQKLRAVANGSAFWANSTSSSSSTRGFQAHSPWGDATIYFDSSGCCTADTQRINANIDTFADYTGDATWWESWHHFAFVKDGQAKRVYIDGKLFLEGLGDPLKTDFTTMVIGGGPSPVDNRMNGFLDDFTVFGGAITEAQALALSGGAAPSTVAGLLAHWDFNDVAAASVKIAVARNGNQLTVTSEPAALPAGWVLQTAPSAAGPWTTQAGATTPLAVTIGAQNTFLRAAKP